MKTLWHKLKRLPWADLRRRAEAFVAGMNRRERALALAIAGTLLTFWLTALLRDLRERSDALDTLAAATRARETLLALGPIVEKRLADRADDLALARSLDAESVMARLEKLLAAAKLKAESGRPATRDTGAAFAHTITLRADAATLAQLVAFRRALDAAALPLAMTGLELDANSADPSKLRARIELTAVQPK